MGIRLNLGRNTSADHAQDFVKKRESPSRMRRRDRRAAERQGESNLANSESVEIIQKDNDNDGEASENVKTVIDVSLTRKLVDHDSARGHAILKP